MVRSVWRSGIFSASAALKEICRTASIPLFRREFEIVSINRLYQHNSNRLNPTLSVRLTDAGAHFLMSGHVRCQKMDSRLRGDDDGNAGGRWKCGDDGGSVGVTTGVGAYSR